MRRCAVTASTHHCTTPAVALASEAQRDAPRAVGIDPGEHLGVGRAVLVESQDAGIDDKVGAGYGFDCRRALFGVDQQPDHAAVLRAGGDEHRPCGTHARDDLRCAGDQPSLVVVGASAEVTVVGKHDCRRYAGGQVAHECFGGRCRIGQQGDGSRGDRRQQRPGQQRLARRLQDACGVDQPATLPAKAFGQMHRVKAVADEGIPPFRPAPRREIAETVAGGGDGGVPGGELPDGVAELLLLRAQSEGHDDGREVTEVGRTD